MESEVKEMKEYVMTFKRFRVGCQYKFYSKSGGYATRTKYACRKRMTIDCAMADYPNKYVECREVNCPVLKKCEVVIV